MNPNQPKTKNIKPYQGNIERQTKQNPDYRNTLFTGQHSQIIVMKILPKQQIGNEVHKNVDQFFRIEQGSAKFSIDNGRERFREKSGDAVMVPAGHWHNVTNPSSTKPLKLYTIYSPSNHPPGTRQKFKPKGD
jgi:mannose-6-phosphate isomerase-like protein (cupin superfamily)